MLCSNQLKASKDRRKLLEQFVVSNGDKGACEASVKVAREDETELEKGMALMTVQDMIDAKFSSSHGMFPPVWYVLGTHIHTSLRYIHEL